MSARNARVKMSERHLLGTLMYRFTMAENSCCDFEGFVVIVQFGVGSIMACYSFRRPTTNVELVKRQVPDR
jgi:hypothetical protein